MDTATPPEMQDELEQDQNDSTQATDASTDAPNENSEQEAKEQAGLTDDLKDALMEVRRIFKESFVPKRQLFIRRALRAFEVLKNNPYILFNESTADYDTLSQIMQGV